MSSISNKNFHNDCKNRWHLPQCPVCYYINNPKLMKITTCMSCSLKNAWFCLTCGHLGCARTKNRHAIKHFEETGHACNMSTETYKVWDYCQKKYVHSALATEKNLLNNNNNNNKDNSCECNKHCTNCKCAVCQHISLFKLQNYAMCMVCEDSCKPELWLCLDCGHLGCSQNHQSHAMKHYELTKHKNSINLVTNRKWNYYTRKNV